MVDKAHEKRYKVRRIALKRPDHAQKLIRRVICKIFDEGAEVGQAGKIANLLTCWLRAYEVSTLEQIEARLTALEKRK